MTISGTRRGVVGRAAGPIGLVSLVVALAVGPAAARSSAVPAHPSRALIIVLDQSRKDTIDRYGMHRVQSLRDDGVSFPNAYLGHMAAETVISHNVITSGKFPKNMGWTNEVYRDVNNRLGGGAGAYHVTSSLGCNDFRSMIQAEGYGKLEDHLGALESDGDAMFVAIGQKLTAACSAGHPAVTDAGPSRDIIVRMGSGVTLDCDANGTSERWRGPSGINVPAYISPTCGRYFVNISSPYNTATTPPAWMYPLDGDRFAVGNTPGHAGGDTWTADAAIDVIENDPNWRGMLLSFGSIDKMGHMWGPEDNEPGETHLPFIAKNADTQVGRVIDKLASKGILDETLVVITADHGAQTGVRFHGVNVGGSCTFPLPSGAIWNAGDTGNCNWYYGDEFETNSLADERYLKPSPAIDQLVHDLGGNLRFSYQDGHVVAWLGDTSLAKLKEAAKAVRHLPDVIASYYREGDRYVLQSAGGPRRRTETAWWNEHGQELVDTMAAADGNGPDVVGLLRDQTTYGVIGDHGGHQRQIQDIPIIFSWAGLKRSQPHDAIRSVDILPTILQTMGIQLPAGLDGKAVALPR